MTYKAGFFLKANEGVYGVVRDAKSRGMDSSVLWMILVMVTSMIELIIYLFSRPQGNLVRCANCNNQGLQASARGPHCGDARNFLRRTWRWWPFSWRWPCLIPAAARPARLRCVPTLASSMCIRRSDGPCWRGGCSAATDRPVPNSRSNPRASMASGAG